MHRRHHGACASLISAACASTRASAKAHRDGADDTNFGVFQNMHINPFPVRAAFDIGTGGMLSLVVARVDAACNAVRDLMYQTQLPLELQSIGLETPETSFVLSEETRADIRNKMRVLHGALRRDNYEGLSERSAIISWPLCEAADAVALADDLTREFKVDVRVLGKTFCVDMPYTSLSSAPSEAEQDELGADKSEAEHATDDHRGDGDIDHLQTLLRRATRRRKGRQESPYQRGTRNTAPYMCTPRVSLPQQMEQLAFLAHVAVSRCMAPHRALVLAEDPCKGICILGTDTTQLETSGGSANDGNLCTNSDALLCQGEASPNGLLIHELPVNLAMAHRLLVTTVQRRSDTNAIGVSQRSPNPVLREEFRQLRSLLEEALHRTLPQWILDKSKVGGTICGSSFNGGVLNIAARVAQRASVSLDHIETHAETHYCGLTDVLLSASYPNAATVVPGAALCSALLRSLDASRFEYLPEVRIPAALLLQPALWTYARSKEIQEALKRRPFYAEGITRRTFQRPHIRENPTAAPTASWQKNKDWNPLSYGNSSKGT
uniref:Uncharacterized protein n=1 Tax=Trypanosoma congolense (strain IL3000) TaxID=1068625 RepID=G0UVU9_TRYCI|nr:conserved hypothetical protein [Trypanosoma congolense IL3000]